MAVPWIESIWKKNLGNCNEFTTLSTRFDRSNDCCMDFAWKWNIQMNVFVALMNLSDSSRAGKLRLAQWDGPKLLSTGGRPEEVWPRRKILGIFFALHFGCSTTGNFRAKLQYFIKFRNLEEDVKLFFYTPLYDAVVVIRTDSCGSVALSWMKKQ